MKSLILPLIIFLGSLYACYYTLEQTRLFNEEQTLRLDTKEENRKVTALADQKEVELKKAAEKERMIKAREFARE